MFCPWFLVLRLSVRYQRPNCLGGSFEIGFFFVPIRLASRFPRHELTFLL